MPLTHTQAKVLLADERLPAMLVDLDAFDHNLATLARHIERRAPTVSARIASKSVRVPRLLSRALARAAPVTRGLLTYDLEECVHLAARGFDDMLLAYPLARERDLRRAVHLSRTCALRIALDDVETLKRAGRIAQEERGTLRVVLCIDMSLRLPVPGGHLGVRRSPIHAVEDVVQVARIAATTAGLRFEGLLSYEAQVAGLADVSSGRPHESLARRAIRGASVRDIARRRRQLADALASAGLELGLHNGGGTGSLDTTPCHAGITEVTFGSGLFKPTLFDGYHAEHLVELLPAAFFALEVTRRPSPAHVTCLGGGYVASGSPGRDREPRPWLPAGLRLLPTEGAGEVQTPLTGEPCAELELGDPVLFRHAKAGEVMERFDEVLLVSGGAVVDRAPTYRGEGLRTL
jgi:D-serine deaminase-like pyridoxal phosphate-dependent protein